MLHIEASMRTNIIIIDDTPMSESKAYWIILNRLKASSVIVERSLPKSLGTLAESAVIRVA